MAQIHWHNNAFPAGLQRAFGVIEIGSKFYDSLHIEVAIKYLNVPLWQG